jgi:hypothetical protein
MSSEHDHMRVHRPICAHTLLDAGIGNKDIIGFYIDDDWGNMNPNGPSEMEGHAMQDMGLTADDLKTIVPGV